MRRWLHFPDLGPPALIVDAIDFDGTNDYHNKSTAWSGISASSQGLLSVWFDMDGGDGARQFIFSARDATGTNNILSVERDASNKVLVALEGSGIAAQILSSSTFVAASGGVHLLASWDTNFSAGNKLLKMVLNGTAEGVITDAGAAFTGPWTAASQEHRLAEQFNGNNNFNGSIAEFYLNVGTYLDVTQASNIAKFRTSDGKPADLGLDGSTPTGTQPTCYFSVRPGDAASVFAVNKGSGGNMTVNGAPAISAWSPSD